MKVLEKATVERDDTHWWTNREDLVCWRNLQCSPYAETIPCLSVQSRDHDAAEECVR